jgi:CDP-4-dehydro-6-deoxyglucose reductase
MIPLPKPQKFQARLASIQKISSKVYLERFVLVEPREIEFVAGQTVMLNISVGVNRSMSIASVPEEKNALLLVHDVGPMGPYSKWALAAKPGDPMSLMGPLGIFVVDKESVRSKVFVATGSGIAPFYAMAKDYVTHGGAGDVNLYWGLRHEEDIFWQKQFEVLARQYPNFHYLITLSAATDSWHGKRGHVEDHIFGSEQNLTGSDFYLCGGKEMTGEMRAKLKSAGVPEPQIKFELFY